MKTLVISYKKAVYPFEKENVSYKILCPKDSFIWKVIYRCGLLVDFYGILYKGVLRNINLLEYDLIIINEMLYPLRFIKFLRRMRYKGKIVYIFWNTLLIGESPKWYNEKKEINKLLKSRSIYDYKLYSFDRNDCQKYSLNYFKQLVYKEKREFGDSDIKQDVFFVGQDKGRLKIIKRLSQQLKKEGLTFKFWVFPDFGHKRDEYTKEDKKFIMKTSWIPYEKVISEDFKSKAILDLVQSGQKGITWRPIEAMFYHKKLITNFSDIKNYDFYDRNNIFIIGEDNFQLLSLFLNTPCKKIPEEIVKRYTFQGFLEDIGKQK